MTTPALIWADTRHKARKQGWLRALFFVARRLTWPDVTHFERSYILSRPIPAAIPDLQPDIPVTFRLATADDVQLLAQIYDYPSLFEAQSLSFKRGDLIALALHTPEDGGEERLIGHHMASFWRESPVPHEADFVEVARRFTITERDAYTHGFMVAPAYRGKRIAAPMGSYLMRALRERGFRRIFTAIAIHNEPSLRASYKMGSRVVGHMLDVAVLGLRYIHVTAIEKDPPAAEG